MVKYLYTFLLGGIMIQICGKCDNNCSECRTYKLLKKEKKSRRKLTDAQKIVRKCRAEIKLILSSVWNNDTIHEQLCISHMGCTISQLREHLQITANRYNIDILNYNHQKYNVDHITPFQKFVDGKVSLNEVTHYTNLQMLSKKENFLKNQQYL